MGVWITVHTPTTPRKVVYMTHTIVSEKHPVFPNVVVGRFFTPEAKAVESGARFTEDEESDREASFLDEVEDKVLRPRGRRPGRPSKGVEAK